MALQMLNRVSNTLADIAKQVDVIDRQTYKRPSRKLMGG